MEQRIANEKKLPRTDLAMTGVEFVDIYDQTTAEKMSQFKLQQNWKHIFKD